MSYSIVTNDPVLRDTEPVKLSDIVGSGYNQFWKFRGRYRVVKGGRGSKKSATTALWIIYNMMRLKLANTLVVRRFFIDHRDSTFSQLKWATHRLGVSHLWRFKSSPFEATYIPTGQKILFRGLDDATSITSLTVEKGFVCWVWFEEASQIENERDVNIIDGSIRGLIPPGYFKQLTFTFNPWSDKHWIKKRFFDIKSPDVFTDTTTFRCNEFLSKEDHLYYDSLPPRRKIIEGDGEWGISEGLVYENWVCKDFDLKEVTKYEDATACYGLDFGYKTDPTGFVAFILCKDRKEIYIFDEIYLKGMSNREIYGEITQKGYRKERIIADSAEPKSIDELRRLGLHRIQPAVKGKDSISFGIQVVNDFTIYVLPKCPNTLTEFGNYCFKMTTGGGFTNVPIGEYNHIMDALRYAVMDKIRFIYGGISKVRKHYKPMYFGNQTTGY